MRYLFLLVMVFQFNPGVTHAIEQSCFSQYGTGIYASGNTYEFIGAEKSDDLFFTQDGQILPGKEKSIINRESYDYTVVSDFAQSEITSNQNALLDDISDTNIEITPLMAPGELNITISFSEKIQKNAIRPILRITGRQYLTKISEDGQQYVQINERDISNYSFQHIRFTFPKQEGNSTSFFISTLRFDVRYTNTYIVKPYKLGPINAYKGWVCDKDKLLALMLERQSISENIPIDLKVEGLQDLIFQNAQISGKDSDNDGIIDLKDNCPNILNSDQKDRNNDGKGDLCSDDDGDSIFGANDNCPTIKNPDQKDLNANNIGDACEFDSDKDGISDGVDNCIQSANPDQMDTDKDGVGDTCDNCNIYNPNQLDFDKTGIGDICEIKIKTDQENDKDADGILDFLDNCKEKANPDQMDTDRDGIGDACDNCISIKNPDQIDEDKNTIGDMCEDTDKDGIDSWRDNCQTVANPDQKDSDNNGIGDMCTDTDLDTVYDSVDNCPALYNLEQNDIDNDLIGDRCDTKDDRFLESNKYIFMGLIGLFALLFIGAIIFLIKKIK